MAVQKVDVGFIFLIVLVVFMFYLAYRFHVSRRIKQQEEMYRKLWKKYYGIEDKSKRKKGR